MNTVMNHRAVSGRISQAFIYCFIGEKLPVGLLRIAIALVFSCFLSAGLIKWTKTNHEQPTFSIYHPLEVSQPIIESPVATKTAILAKITIIAKTSKTTKTKKKHRKKKNRKIRPTPMFGCMGEG